MMEWDYLYQRHNGRMEDFWSRRANQPRLSSTIRVFGREVRFHSNHEGVLEAAGMAEPLYSLAAPNEQPPWDITLIVHDPVAPPGSPPENLVDLLHFAGADDWLSIGLAAWGSCFADLTRGSANAVLASSLAARPDLVHLVLVNTILTNTITRHGYGMLHASALVKDGQLLLLMAPHGAGKSTAALHLLTHGYRLLSDSMIYVGEADGDVRLGGFPVGRIKLRSDVLAQFPQLAAKARPERVRAEIKHMLALDAVDPAMAYTQMCPIRQVQLCLLERWDQKDSRLRTVSRREIWPDIMVNSLHFDSPRIWQSNLSRIELLLEHADLHRLQVGTDESKLVEAIESLWARET